MKNKAHKVLLSSNPSKIKKSIERYGDIVDTLETKFDKAFIRKIVMTLLYLLDIDFCSMKVF